MRLTRPLVALLLSIAPLAGCRSPEVAFYVMPTPNGGDIHAQDDGAAVIVSAIEVPRIVDRPQLVWRTSETALHADDFHRWGASLPAEIQRALMEHLRAMLRTNTVVSEPAELPGLEPLRLTVYVQQLDAHAGSGIYLRAVYTVRRGEQRDVVARGEAEVRAPLEGEGPTAVVKGYGIVVEGMARQIAERLKAVPPPPPPAPVTTAP